MTGKMAGWKRIVGDFQVIGDHVTDTDIGTAEILTPPDGASKILVQATGADCRYTLDGTTTPEAAVGFQLKSDDPPLLIVIAKGLILTIIEEGATAVLNYQWGA